MLVPGGDASAASTLFLPSTQESEFYREGNTGLVLGGEKGFGSTREPAPGRKPGWDKPCRWALQLGQHVLPGTGSLSSQAAFS